MKKKQLCRKLFEKMKGRIFSEYLVRGTGQKENRMSPVLRSLLLFLIGCGISSAALSDTIPLPPNSARRFPPWFAHGPGERMEMRLYTPIARRTRETGNQNAWLCLTSRHGAIPAGKE
jgi:hypothetical protein